VIVTLRSDAGPLEGFESASFRVAVNDEGVGTLTALPEVVDGISGRVVCTVDGTDVFSWTPEERTLTAADRDTVTVTGRGRAADFERAIVLPVGYPNYTSRTRAEQGPPFAIWADLLAEAQARGRLAGIAPSWTPTEDSNGDPWTTVVDLQLEPGTTLRQLLDEFVDFDDVEWRLRPDGTIDAAPEIGADLSGEVVLFLGRDQIQLNTSTSSRDTRQTLYLEASTGVSEAVAPYADPEAGEIWLQAQDFADPVTRAGVAQRIVERLSLPDVEVTVGLVPDCGAFDLFEPGDRIGLDTGTGTLQRARVVGLSVEIRDTVRLEATLVSEVTLRARRIDRSIQQQADVQLAASPSLQRRHGLVTADKFLSGAVGTDVAISSENFVPAIPGPGQGWAIFGNGDAEFNNAIFRGDLQSDNYVPGVSGWSLDRDGDSEMNEGKFRGLITGSAFTTDDGTGAGHIVISGNPALDPESPGVNQIAFIPDTTFFPSGSYAAPALVQVLDTGGMALASVAGSSGTDASVLLLRTNGIDLDAGPNGFQGIGISAPDGPIDLAPGTGLPVTVNGNLVVTGTTSLRATSTRALTADGANRDISGYRNISFTGVISGNGSGLTNLPIPPLPTDPTFNSVRVNTSLFFNTTTFPRFEQSGTGVQLRGTGALRMKFDGGFALEDGDMTFTAAGRFVSRAGAANLAFTSVSAIAVRNIAQTTLTTNNVNWRASDQQLCRPSSSARFKQDIQDAPEMPRLLEAAPRTFRGIQDVLEQGDDAVVSFGAIAEEFHELGLTPLVQYGDDGQPEALNYHLIGLALIPHVRDLAQRVADLEEAVRGA